MDLTVYNGTHGITRGAYLQQVEITARRGDPFNMETTETETKTKTEKKTYKKQRRSSRRECFRKKWKAAAISSDATGSSSEYQQFGEDW